MSLQTNIRLTSMIIFFPSLSLLFSLCGQTGIEPVAPALQGGFLTTGQAGKPQGRFFLYTFLET